MHVQTSKSQIVTKFLFEKEEYWAEIKKYMSDHK